MLLQLDGVAAYGKSKKCGISTSSRTNHKFSSAIACVFPDLREMMMTVSVVMYRNGSGLPRGFLT